MNLVEQPELGDRERVFRDRRDAGRALADLVRTVAPPDALVLAVPAGGVPVAREVADRCGLPLVVAVVSKVTFPWNTESGYGAVAFDGSVLLDPARAATVGEQAVAQGIAATRARVERRQRLFRGAAAPLALAGRPAILVDDGIAAGLTMRAAVAAVRKAGAGRIVIAVPTAQWETLERLDADVVVCPNVRAGYPFAVADAYLRWCDVDEEEALALLRPVSARPD